MSIAEPSREEAIRARADLLTALVLVALGLAVLYLSWTMPRLEARRIHPATIPGLVPLVLGGLLTMCGGLLAIRSWRVAPHGGWQGLFGLFVTPETRRVLAAMALALFYTLVLVGWLPFWVASGLFIFAFILLFEMLLVDARGSWMQSGIWALGIAIAGSLGIYFVFARIFLVRLP